MINLTTLLVFSRVVETGSFSKAAQALGVGQPSVTKHIAAMEKKYGSRLLNRNSRGVAVTDAGRELYAKCRRIASELDEIELFIGQQKSHLEGVLRISASVSFGHKIISPLVIEFIEANPEVRVDLTCGNPYADLIGQGVDVAIRMGDLPDSSLGSRRVGTNPWAMIAAPSYLRSAGDLENIDDLADRDGLIYSSLHNDDVWKYRVSPRTKRPIKIKERLRSNNLTAILDATTAGLGIAIVPLYLAVPDLQSGRVVRIMEHESLHEQEIHAVYPSPTLVPGRVQAFIKFIRHKFKSEWWLG